MIKFNTGICNIVLFKVNDNSNDFDFRRTGELWYNDGNFHITEPNITNKRFSIIGLAKFLTEDLAKSFLDYKIIENKTFYLDYDKPFGGYMIQDFNECLDTILDNLGLEYECKYPKPDTSLNQEEYLKECNIYKKHLDNSGNWLILKELEK